MIIQVQGVTIKTFATVAGQDSTYGEILNYNNCGNYELAQVYAIPNSTSIQLDCGLTYNYTAAGRVVIVRVPRYTSLTVNAGASLTGDAWNGTIGGILSVEVDGACVINGTVTATGMGFRGGVSANNSNFGGTRYVDLGGGLNEGGQKGESVAGTWADYIALFGGAYAKGAPANGGGGGNSHNTAGGGGANAGGLTNWTGYGVANPAYATAFNLEFPGRAAIISPGGGRGGYGFSSNNVSPNTNAPGASAWGGANRPKHGGHGGRCLDYSTGKIFMGGGGGAAHVNGKGMSNATGSDGGPGGGLIFIQSYGAISGTGTIESNGVAGQTSSGTATFGNVAGDDPAGGGGAGGTIIVSTQGGISGVTCNANGGVGGNVILTASFTTNNQGFGPGGGGGGGYIANTSGAATQNVNGGSCGIMTGGSSQISTNFPVNGATNGNSGLKNQSIPNYTISAINQTVCINSSAVLTANSNQPLANFIWYNSLAGPTQIGTGAAYTTSVFASTGTYTFYAGMCPGNYRIPVLVTVTNGPTVTANSTTICSGQSTTLTASGASSYTWSTGAISSSVIVSPTALTLYTVIGANGTCSSTATSTVNVVSGGSISINSASICSGQSATLTAGSASSYTWSTGSNLQTITVTPVTTTIYTIQATIGSGCFATNTTQVIVNTPPAISVNNATICNGQIATLTASNAISYLWTDGASTNSHTFSPTTTSSYTVTGTSNNCTASAIGNVVVNINPTISVNNYSICSGQTASITASGATNYTWDPAGTNFIGSTFTVSPSANTVYQLIGATNGCTTSTSFSITVGSNLSVSVNNSTICPGQSATLIATSSATNYVWSNSATSATNIVSPAVTTNYTIIANYAGCTGSNVANVIVSSPPVINITGNNTICIGQSTTLFASGASSYTWDTGIANNTINVSPASNTSYSVIGSIGSCTGSAIYNVSVMPSPTLSFSGNTSICSGQTTTLNALGATNYTWQPINVLGNLVSISPTITTNYTVIGENGTCVSSTIITVNVNQNSPLSISNSSICNGYSVTLSSGVTAQSYTWSTGANTASINVSPNTTSVYSVSLTTASGCILNGTTAVVITPAPLITITGNANLCLGQTTQLSASGAPNYTWLPGNYTSSQISITPNTSGVYTAQYNNINGCTSSATILVTVNTPPQLSFNIPNKLFCKGENVNLNVQGSAATSWTVNGNYYGGNNITINPVSSTNIYVTSSNGACSSSSVFPIKVTSLTASFITKSNYVDYPATVIFTNTSQNYISTYWDFGNGNTSTESLQPSVYYENPGIYLVALITTDSLGCKDTAFYRIEAGCNTGDIYIPNTFTPNGDGNNDVFKIYGGYCLTSFSCSIFDRWGNELIKLNTLSDTWDGTFKGQLCELGTYNYLIKYTLYNGKSLTKTGVINIIK